MPKMWKNVKVACYFYNDVCSPFALNHTKYNIHMNEKIVLYMIDSSIVI